MSDIAIRVEGLSKKYQIGGPPVRYNTLRDKLTSAARNSLQIFNGRNGRGKARQETFWALKEVSFDIKRGEVLGVIGRNGAGKSTLLKVLSRITEPTAGRVRIQGRIGSLLEVGTGFHPELTGRENIFLNGAILGMRKNDIDRQFDEIVAFAEVEQFIDTPVKHYSSGMYLRLAFAVAAHLEPDILIVDEVLAVGDLVFQKKCLGKMGEVAGQGRTVLLVSHNMGSLSRLCTRCLWLEKGEVRDLGSPTAVITEYQSTAVIASAEWVRTKPEEVGPVTFLRVTLRGGGTVKSYYQGDESVMVTIHYRVTERLEACGIAVRVLASDGLTLLTTSDADHLRVAALPKEPGLYEAAFTIPGSLFAPGSYSLSVAAHAPQRQVYEALEQPVAFEISAIGSMTSIDGRYGLLAPSYPWETMFQAPAIVESRVS